jgi:hypothetical protein
VEHPEVFSTGTGVVGELGTAGVGELVGREGVGVGEVETVEVGRLGVGIG